MARESLLEETIGEEAIARRVWELGKEISDGYRGLELVTVSILKGSVIFTADLVRNIDLPLEMVFMAVSSYGSGTVASGEPEIILDVGRCLEGKDVLIVEDIIDTGNTLFFLREHFKRMNVSSFKICALLDKPSRRVKDIEPDYRGFSIEDYFAVGYGMDAGNRYRNLKNICKLRSL